MRVKPFTDFERYFSQHTETDTEALAKIVEQSALENIAKIHPDIFPSIPGIVNIVSDAVCGGVLNLLRRYHEWLGGAE